jgi:hypothetical protein
MPVTHDQLLEYACGLPSANELDFRAAVNRGYYAAYHAARLFHENLESGGCPPTRPVGLHERLYHQLTNPTVSDAAMKTRSRQIGLMGRDLKTHRTNADYELDETISKEDAAYVIEQAKALIERASGL